MEQPKRKQNRIKEYDYSQNGAYFVTICTKNRKNTLCNIVGEGLCALPNIELTAIGKEIEKSIRYINENYQSVYVGKYVVMPNHIHLMIMINRETGGDGTPPLQDIIGRFKSYTTNRFNEINDTENDIFWQRSFHDHIIRNERDHLEVWNYIDINPLKWEQDKYNKA